MKKLILTLATAGVALSFASIASARDLDREKHEKRSEAKFADADTDSDGVLTSAEVKAMLVVWEEKRAERKGETVRDIKPRRLTRFITSRDTDSNGKVEKAGYMTERMTWFDSRDANKDGVLSDDERKNR